MSSAMQQVAAGNPILDAIEAEARVLVWEAFDLLKDQTFTVHLHIFGIPINPSISIKNFEGIIERIAGPRPVAQPSAIAIDPPAPPAPAPAPAVQVTPTPEPTSPSPVDVSVIPEAWRGRRFTLITADGSRDLTTTEIATMVDWHAYAEYMKENPGTTAAPWLKLGATGAVGNLAISGA